MPLIYEDKSEYIDCEVTHAVSFKCFICLWSINMNPPRPNTTAAANLDLLRVIAAFFVAFGHVRLMLIYEAGSIDKLNIFQKLFYFLTNLGGESVLVFFVLSGFLVGSTVLRDVHNNNFDWKKYAITRASRLYVVLIPAIVIGITLDVIGSTYLSKSIVYSTPSYGVMLPANIMDAISFKIVIGNLFFAQEILVPTVGSNHPLWSLTNEAWYYLIFPLIVLGIGRKTSNLKRMGFLLAAAAILTFVLPQKISALFIAWLIGALIYIIPKLNTKVWHTLGVFAMLFIWTALRSSKVVDENFLVTSLLTALLVYCLVAQDFTCAPKYIKLSNSIASMSYSLYLFHTPFIVLLSALILRQNVKLHPDFQGILLCVVVCGAAILYSTTMYYLFERRTGDIRNRLLRESTH